jgi:uncharacterized protein YndB with AHSA1/START domain
MKLQDRLDPHARMTGTATLVIQRWLPGGAERVWRYLTDSDLRRKWLASGDMRLQAGAPLELVWRNDALSADADTRPAGFPDVERLQSRVLAVEPMRMLQIAWGEGDVTFTLEEKGDRVLMTVTHRGIDDGAEQFSTAAGWHMHLDILVALASDAAPPSFWSGWTDLHGIYTHRLSQLEQEQRPCR